MAAGESRASAGGQVKPDQADPANHLYALTFIDQGLGMVGWADLIFAGKDMLPSEVRCRVYAGQAGYAPGGDPGIEEREAMMERLSGKTEELFIHNKARHLGRAHADPHREEALDARPGGGLWAAGRVA